MRAIEVPFRLQLPKDPMRTGGLHQSSIIKAMALKYNYLDPEWDVPEITDPMKVIMGLMSEEWLSKNAHPECTFHPGELERDGVKGSADGISELTPDEYTRVWMPNQNSGLPSDFETHLMNEFKCTWKSSRVFGAMPVEPKDATAAMSDKRFWMWITQIKGYLKMWSTRWARLHALFIRGDYSNWSSGPDYRVFNLEFSQWEIDENWDMIVAHKELGVIE